MGGDAVGAPARLCQGCSGSGELGTIVGSGAEESDPHSVGQLWLATLAHFGRGESAPAHLALSTESGCLVRHDREDIAIEHAELPITDYSQPIFGHIDNRTENGIAHRQVANANSSASTLVGRAIDLVYVGFRGASWQHGSSTAGVKSVSSRSCEPRTDTNEAHHPVG